MTRDGGPGRGGSLRICGIDPGLRRTGWGVVEIDGNRLRWVADGAVCPDPAARDSERLHSIHTGLAEVLDGHRPDQGAVEEVFMSRNAAAALKLGMARGAAMLVFAGRGLPVAEIAARRVKQNVTGSGRADKGQVTAMVTRLLGIVPETEDSADALAIAIASVNEAGAGIPAPAGAPAGYEAAVARALARDGGRA